MSTIPSWLEKEGSELITIAAVDLRDRWQFEDVFDYVSDRKNIKFLENHLKDQPKGTEYILEINVDLTKGNLEKTCKILSSLSHLVSQLCTSFKIPIDGDQDDHESHLPDWNLFIDQITKNIQHGSLWKLKAISFSGHMDDRMDDVAEYLTSMTQRLLCLATCNDVLISLTLELQYQWIDYLMHNNNKSEYESFKNALIHSTNLGELYIDIDFHLLKERGYKYLNFVLGIFDAIKLNQSISSVRWQCYNSESKGLTLLDYDLDDFEQKINTLFWPKFTECFTSKKINNNRNQIIPYKRNRYFSHGPNDMEMFFIIDYFIKTEAKSLNRAANIKSMVDAFNDSENNQNCINSLILDVWECLMNLGLIYSVCDLIHTNNNQNFVEKLVLTGQMDDDKLMEMLKHSIIHKRNNLQILELSLGDRGQTVQFTKHYTDIISNMSNSNCPQLWWVFLCDIDIENQFKDIKENEKFVDAVFVFLERKYSEMIMIQKCLANEAVDSIQLIMEYVMMPECNIELHFSWNEQYENYGKVLAKYWNDKVPGFVKQIGVDIDKCVGTFCCGQFKFSTNDFVIYKH